ncbi:hypothetical protein RV18_GL001839 [Enterococcus termitis]|nr:hypothetical protein RV18_GL001839 [Enterococcus termitis]
MNYRLGPSSYDCSSAVYNALIAGGFLPANTNIGNTETLFNDLERNGWQQVQPVNGNYPTKRGDVFIWGDRGFTLGAAGHTGMFIDDADNIIHCNYGYNGITVNDHDQIWNANGQPTITIYRQPRNGTTANISNSDEEPTKTMEKDDDIMFKFIKVQKNGSKEIWFVFGNKRMYLPTPKHVENADLLLKRTGHATKEEAYSHDNYALKMIEKATDIVKL